MPSNYTINVSRNGSFYFRIVDQNATEFVISQMVRDLRVRFPEGEGFAVDLTRWNCYGQSVEVSNVCKL